MNMYSNSTRFQAPTIHHPDETARPLCNSAERTNDGVSPYSAAPVKRDAPNGRSRLMKQTRHILVATMNVRTIRTENKKLELPNLFNQHSLNVLGIIDHKNVHDDEDIVVLQINKSSAWRNAQ